MPRTDLRKGRPAGIGSTSRKQNWNLYGSAGTLRKFEHRLCQLPRFLIQIALQIRTVVMQMIQAGPACGQRQWMAHKCAGEKCHACFRDRCIAVIPLAAIQSVQILGIAGNNADGDAAADHFAVGGNVGLDAEIPLCAARMNAETSNDFVEDQSRTRFLGSAYAAPAGIPWAANPAGGSAQARPERRPVRAHVRGRMSSEAGSP